MQGKARWRSSSIHLIDLPKENNKINGSEVIFEEVKAEVFFRIKEKYESLDWKYTLSTKMYKIDPRWGTLLWNCRITRVERGTLKSY